MSRTVVLDAGGGAAADRRPVGLQHAQGRHGFAAGSGAFGASQIHGRSTDASSSAAVNPQDTRVQSVQGSAAPSPNQHAMSTGKSTGTPSPVLSPASNWSQPAWTPEERTEYVSSLGVVTLPGEEVILRFLGDALSKAPLPSPWHMARDVQGRTFFANRSTNASTWKHPLEPSLRELAGVCRMCLTFPAPLRESTIATLLETWQSEAKQELVKWCAVKDANGKEYYCHRETMESMWEHPAEVVLPMHYLKIRSIERLRGEGALTSLRSQVAPHREPQDAHAMAHKAATSPAAVSEAAPKRDAAGSSPSGYPHERQAHSSQAQPQLSPSGALAAPVLESALLSPLSQRRAKGVRLQGPAFGAGPPDVTRRLPEGQQPQPRRCSLGAGSDPRAAEAPQELQALRSELAEARRQHQEEVARSKCVAIKDAEEACTQQLHVRDLEDVRRDLERHLGSATAAKASLQDELRHAEGQLQAAGTAHQRTLQLEAELQEERRTTEEQAMDCQKLSDGFRHALESVAEAERGRLFLEVRLAAVYQDDATRDKILSSQDDVTRSFLEAAHKEEVGRRERLAGLDGSRQAVQGLLDQASTRQRGLESELEAAERELRESRAVALDFKEWAVNAEAEMERERAQARRTQLAFDELAAESGASERQRDELQARLSQAEKELAGIQSSEGESALLRNQLAALSANTGAVQSGYEQAMQELSAARAAGDATKDRALQAEAQLLADRRNFDQALEHVREAERARATLEAKLAVVEKGMEERDALAGRVHDLQHELAEAISQASVDKVANDDKAQQLEEQLRQAAAKLQDSQEHAQALSTQALAQEQGEERLGSRLEELQAQIAEQAERAEASLAAERQKVDLAEKGLHQSEAELERAAAECEGLQASLQAAGAANASMAGLQAMLEREQERERGLSAKATAAELQLAEERRNLQRVEQRLESLEQAKAEEERGAPECESAPLSRQASKAEAQLAQERQGVAVLEVKLQASEAAAEAAERARNELTAQLLEWQQRQVAIAREAGQLQAALEAQTEASQQAKERLAELERRQSGSVEEIINAQKKLAEEQVRLELAEHKLKDSNTALAAASSERAASKVSLAEEQERHTVLSGHAAELEERLSLEKSSVEALEKQVAHLEAASAKFEEDRNALAVRLAEEESSRLSVGNATEELTKMLADEQESQDQLQRQIGSMESQLEHERASLEAAHARLGEAEAAAKEASDSFAARSLAHATETAALESQLSQERRSAEVIEQRLADEETQRNERSRVRQCEEERVAELKAELAETRRLQEGLSQQAAQEAGELVGLRTELAEKHQHQEELSRRLAQAETELAQARESASRPALVQTQGGTAIEDAIEERAAPTQQAVVPLEMEVLELHRSSAPAEQVEQIDQVQVQQLQPKPTSGQEAEMQALRTEVQEAREAEEKTRRLAAEAELQHENERQRFERTGDRLQRAKDMLEERQQALERGLLKIQEATTSNEDVVSSLKASLADANHRQAQLSLENDSMATALAAARAAQAAEESQREKLTLDVSELEASGKSAQAALDEQRWRAEQLSARCRELETLSAQARVEVAEAQQRSAEYEAVVTQGQDATLASTEKMTLDLQALEASRSSAQVALDEERERARQLSSRCKELEQRSSDAKAELAQAQERNTAFEATVAQEQDVAAAQGVVRIENAALDLKALEASKTTAQVALDQERSRAMQLSARCKDLEQLCSQGKADLAQASADLAAAEAKANQSTAQAVSPVVEIQEPASQQPSATTAQEAQVDGSPEAARRELLEQLEQATSAQEQLREGLRNAEAEVAASRDRGSAASKRAAQAEAELARERERARTELERFQEARRAKAVLEAHLAAAEQGLAGGQADGVADVNSRIQGLRDELEAEQERGARLVDAQQQLASSRMSSENLCSELMQSRSELETLRAQGDSTLDRATRAEAELQQERQRATAEAKRASEAANTKALLEGRLAQVEKDKMSNESSLKVAQKKLQEQEQELSHAQELERRLNSLEPKLEALEQHRASNPTTVRGDAKVAELEQRLAQATAWQAQLRAQLLAAEKEANSTKAVAEDFRAFAAQAQAALTTEGKKQGMTEQEAAQLPAGRDEAPSAESKPEAKVLDVGSKSGERHALQVAALEKPAASRVDDFAAGGASALQQAKFLEKKFKDEHLHCTFKVEGIDYQQLMDDRNLKAAFEATVKQTLASEAGDLVPKSIIRLVFTAGSVVVQASFEPTPGLDLGALARRLRSSRAFPRKVTAYVSALDGIQRIACGPIKVANLSIAFDSELRVRDDAGPFPGAVMSKSLSGDLATPKGGMECSRMQAQWEPLASKFFNRLDRLGTGSVENFQVLQLWPLLSRQVDSSNAAALAAQLLQSTSPMNGLEWMALMKALHSIVGPRRLKRNLRSAEAYYGELRAGGAPAAELASPAGSPASPLDGAKEFRWPVA